MGRKWNGVFFVTLENGRARRLDLDRVSEYGVLPPTEVAFFNAAEPDKPLKKRLTGYRYYVKTLPDGEVLFLTRESLNKLCDAVREAVFGRVKS